MNKSLVSLLFSVCALAGCSSTPTQEELAKTIKPDVERWLLFQKKSENEEEAQKEVIEGLTWRREEGENWMSVKKAITLGYGDCEEEAMAGAYKAGLLGYPRKIIIVTEGTSFPWIFSQPRGHSYTFLEKEINGKMKYGLYDPSNFCTPKYDSIEAMLKDANRVRKFLGLWKIRYYQVVDLDKEFGDEWIYSEENLYDEAINFGNYTKLRD